MGRSAVGRVSRCYNAFECCFCCCCRRRHVWSVYPTSGRSVGYICRRRRLARHRRRRIIKYVCTVGNGIRASVAMSPPAPPSAPDAAHGRPSCRGLRRWPPDAPENRGGYRALQCGDGRTDGRRVSTVDGVHPALLLLLPTTTTTLSAVPGITIIVSSPAKHIHQPVLYVARHRPALFSTYTAVHTADRDELFHREDGRCYDCCSSSGEAKSGPAATAAAVGLLIAVLPSPMSEILFRVIYGLIWLFLRLARLNADDTSSNPS